MAMEFPTMSSITNAAKASGLAVYRVRQLCKEGRIKFICCGRRTLVNMESLAAYLNEGDVSMADTSEENHPARPVGQGRWCNGKRVYLSLL